MGNTILWLLLFLVVFAIVLTVSVVVLFVVVGAFKLYRSKQEAAKLEAEAERERISAALASVDVSDGLDAKELQIIREVFSKQKQQEDQAAVKARMAKAAAAV